MQVDDHLQPVEPSPADRFREVGELALNIRFAGSNLKGPVAYGDSNMVQAEVWASALDGNPEQPQRRPSPSRRNVCKIFFRDPGIPMLFQSGGGGRPVLTLAERPLIHDTVIASTFEQTWRNPWLENAVVRLQRGEISPMYNTPRERAIHPS